METKKEGKTLMSYWCGWCSTKFERNVGKEGKQSESAKRGDVSDQVICPNCGNFLKTWG